MIKKLGVVLALALGLTGCRPVHSGGYYDHHHHTVVHHHVVVHHYHH